MAKGPGGRLKQARSPGFKSASALMRGPPRRAAPAPRKRRAWAAKDPRRNRPYNNRQWRATRERVLLEQPECRECGRAATVVDHAIPHRGDPKRFWDYSNLQGLCRECHDAKTGQGL